MCVLGRTHRLYHLPLSLPPSYKDGPRQPYTHFYLFRGARTVREFVSTVFSLQTFAFFLALLFFSSNVVFIHSQETNFWSERRQRVKEAGLQTSGIEVASLPVQLPFVAPLEKIPCSLAIHDPAGGRLTGLSQSTALDRRLASVSNHSGIVKEVWFPPASPGPLVVLLQDVHMNPEAQANMAGILTSLCEASGDRKNGRFVVGVEGASGIFDFRRFRAFPDRTKTKLLADYFLKERRLAAASFVGITAEKSPLLLGIDDDLHYRANVEAYRKAVSSAEPVRKLLDELESRLEKEKKAHLNGFLRKFDELKFAHESGRIGLAAYVRVLEKMKPNEEEDPWSDRDLELEKFLAASSLEASLDFSRAEQERGEVLKSLARSLSRDELDSFVAMGLGYRQGRLSFADYYRSLQNLLERHALSLSRTPSFADYMRYVFLADGIHADRLWAAVRSLERRVQNTLVKSPVEKELMLKSRKLFLMRKLTQFSLTPTEWKEYCQISHAETAVSSSSRRKPGSRLLTLLDPDLRRDDGSMDPDLRRDDEIAIQPFEQFYSEADTRSQRMVGNLLEVAPRGHGGGEMCVLVAGGFHTPSIIQYLKGRSVPYAVVQPKVTQLEEESGTAYLSIFTREKTPLERLFEGERLFLAPRNGLVGSKQGGMEETAELFVALALGSSLNAALPVETGVVRKKPDSRFPQLSSILVKPFRALNFKPVHVVIGPDIPRGFRVVKRVVYPLTGLLHYVVQSRPIQEIWFPLISLAIQGVFPASLGLWFFSIIFNAVIFAAMHDNQREGSFDAKAFLIRSAGTFIILGLAGLCVDPLSSITACFEFLGLTVGGHAVWNGVVPKRYQLNRKVSPPDGDADDLFDEIMNEEVKKIEGARRQKQAVIKQAVRRISSQDLVRQRVIAMFQGEPSFDPQHPLAFVNNRVRQYLSEIRSQTGLDSFMKVVGRLGRFLQRLAQGKVYLHIPPETMRELNKIKRRLSGVQEPSPDVRVGTAKKALPEEEESEPPEKMDGRPAVATLARGRDSPTPKPLAPDESPSVRGPPAPAQASQRTPLTPPSQADLQPSPSPPPVPLSKLWIHVGLAFLVYLALFFWVLPAVSTYLTGFVSVESAGLTASFFGVLAWYLYFVGNVVLVLTFLVILVRAVSRTVSCQLLPRLRNTEKGRALLEWLKKKGEDFEKHIVGEKIIDLWKTMYQFGFERSNRLYRIFEASLSGQTQPAPQETAEERLFRQLRALPFVQLMALPFFAAVGLLKKRVSLLIYSTVGTALLMGLMGGFLSILFGPDAVSHLLGHFLSVNLLDVFGGSGWAESAAGQHALVGAALHLFNLHAILSSYLLNLLLTLGGHAARLKDEAQRGKPRRPWVLRMVTYVPVWYWYFAKAVMDLGSRKKVIPFRRKNPDTGKEEVIQISLWRAALGAYRFGGLHWVGLEIEFLKTLSAFFEPLHNLVMKIEGDGEDEGTVGVLGSGQILARRLFSPLGIDVLDYIVPGTGGKSVEEIRWSHQVEELVEEAEKAAEAKGPSKEGKPQGPAEEPPSLGEGPDKPQLPQPGVPEHYAWVTERDMLSGAAWDLYQKEVKQRAQMFASGRNVPVEIPEIALDERGIPIHTIMRGGRVHLVQVDGSGQSTLPIERARFDPLTRTFKPEEGKAFEPVRITIEGEDVLTLRSDHPLLDTQGQPLPQGGFLPLTGRDMSGSWVSWRNQSTGEITEHHPLDQHATPVEPGSRFEVVYGDPLAMAESKAEKATRDVESSRNRAALVGELLDNPRGAEAFIVDRETNAYRRVSSLKQLPDDFATDTKVDYWAVDDEGSRHPFQPEAHPDKRADEITVRDKNGREYEVLFPAGKEGREIIARTDAKISRTDVIGAVSVSALPQAPLQTPPMYAMVVGPDGMVPLRSIREAAKWMERARVQGLVLEAVTKGAIRELTVGGYTLTTNDSPRFKDVLRNWYVSHQMRGAFGVRVQTDPDDRTLNGLSELKIPDQEKKSLGRLIRTRDGMGVMVVAGDQAQFQPLAPGELPLFRESPLAMQLGDTTWLVKIAYRDGIYIQKITDREYQQMVRQMEAPAPGSSLIKCNLATKVKDGAIVRTYDNPQEVRRLLRDHRLVYCLSNGQEVPALLLTQGLEMQGLTIIAVLDPTDGTEIRLGSEWLRLEYLMNESVREECLSRESPFQTRPGVPPVVIGNKVMPYAPFMEVEMTQFLEQLRTMAASAGNPAQRQALYEQYRQALEIRMYMKGGVPVILKGTLPQRLMQSQRELRELMGAFYRDQLMASGRGGEIVIPSGIDGREVQIAQDELEGIQGELEVLDAQAQLANRAGVRLSPQERSRMNRERARLVRSINQLSKQIGQAQERIRKMPQGVVLRPFSADFPFEASQRAQADYLQAVQGPMKELALKSNSYIDAGGNEHIIVTPLKRAEERADREETMAQRDRELLQIQQKIMKGEPVAVHWITEGEGEATVTRMEVKDLKTGQEMRERFLRWAKENNLPADQIEAALKEGRFAFRDRQKRTHSWLLLDGTYEKGIVIHEVTDPQGGGPEATTVEFEPFEAGEKVREEFVIKMKRALQKAQNPRERKSIQNRITRALEHGLVADTDEAGQIHKWRFVFSLAEAERNAAKKASQLEFAKQQGETQRTIVYELDRGGQLEKLVSDPEGIERHKLALAKAKAELEIRYVQLKDQMKTVPRRVIPAKAGIQSGVHGLDSRFRGNDGILQQPQIEARAAEELKQEIAGVARQIRDTSAGLYTTAEGKKIVVKYGRLDAREQYLKSCQRLEEDERLDENVRQRFTVLDEHGIPVGGLKVEGGVTVFTEPRVLHHDPRGTTTIENRIYVGGRMRPGLVDHQTARGVLSHIERIVMDKDQRIRFVITGYVRKGELVPLFVTESKFAENADVRNLPIASRTYRFVPDLDLDQYEERFGKGEMAAVGESDRSVRIGERVYYSRSDSPDHHWIEVKDLQGRLLMKIEGILIVEKRGQREIQRFAPTSRILCFYEDPLDPRNQEARLFAALNVPYYSREVPFIPTPEEMGKFGDWLVSADRPAAEGRLLGESRIRCSFDDYLKTRLIRFEKHDYVERTWEWEDVNPEGLLVRKFLLRPRVDDRGQVLRDGEGRWQYVPANVTEFVYNYDDPSRLSMGVADRSYTFPTDAAGNKVGPFFKYARVEAVFRTSAGDVRVLYRLCVRNGSRVDYEQYQEVKGLDGFLYERHVGHKSGDMFVPEKITFNFRNLVQERQIGHVRKISHSRTYRVNFQGGPGVPLVDLSRLAHQENIVRDLPVPDHPNLRVELVLEDESKVMGTNPETGSLFYLQHVFAYPQDPVTGELHAVVKSRFIKEVWQGESVEMRKIVLAEGTPTPVESSHLFYDIENDVVRAVVVDEATHPSQVQEGPNHRTEELRRTSKGITVIPHLPDGGPRLYKNYAVRHLDPQGVVFMTSERWDDVNGDAKVAVRHAKADDGRRVEAITISVDEQDAAEVSGRLESVGSETQVRIKKGLMVKNDDGSVDVSDSHLLYFRVDREESMIPEGSFQVSATFRDGKGHGPIVFRSAAGDFLRTDVPKGYPTSEGGRISLTANSLFPGKSFVFALRVADLKERGLDVTCLNPEMAVRLESVRGSPGPLRVSYAYRAGSVSTPLPSPESNASPALASLIPPLRPIRIPQVVIPAKAGIQAVNLPQKNVENLDPRFRGDDGLYEDVYVSREGQRAFYDADRTTKEGRSIVFTDPDTGRTLAVYHSYLYAGPMGEPLEQRWLDVFDLTGKYPVARVMAKPTVGEQPLAWDRDRWIPLSIVRQGNLVQVYGENPITGYKRTETYRVDAPDPSLPENIREGYTLWPAVKSADLKNTIKNKVRNWPLNHIRHQLTGTEEETEIVQASEEEADRAVKAVSPEMIMWADQRFDLLNDELPTDKRPLKVEGKKLAGSFQWMKFLPWTWTGSIFWVIVLWLIWLLPYTLWAGKKWDKKWEALRAKKASEDNQLLYDEDTMKEAFQRLRKEIMKVQIRGRDDNGTPIFFVSDAHIEGAFLNNLFLIYFLCFSWSQKAGWDEADREAFLKEVDSLTYGVWKFLSKKTGQGSDRGTARDYVKGKVDTQIWDKLEIYLSSFRDKLKKGFLIDRKKNTLKNGFFRKAHKEMLASLLVASNSKDTNDRWARDEGNVFEFNEKNLNKFIAERRFAEVPGAFFVPARYLVKLLPVIWGLIISKGGGFTARGALMPGFFVPLVVLLVALTLIINIWTERKAIKASRVTHPIWGRWRAALPLLTIMVMSFMLLTYDSLSEPAWALIWLVIILMSMESLGILLPRRTLYGGNRSLFGVAWVYHTRLPSQLGRWRTVRLVWFTYFTFVVVSLLLGQTVLPWFIVKYCGESKIKTLLALIVYGTRLPLLHHGINIFWRFIFSWASPDFGPKLKGKPDPKHNVGIVHIGGITMGSQILTKNETVDTLANKFMDRFFDLWRKGPSGRDTMRLFFSKAALDPALLWFNKEDLRDKKKIEEAARRMLTDLFEAELTADKWEDKNNEPQGTTLWSLRQMTDPDMPKSLQVAQNEPPNKKASIAYGWELRRQLIEMGSVKLQDSLDTAMSFVELAETAADAGLAKNLIFYNGFNQYDNHGNQKNSPGALSLASRSEAGQRIKHAMLLTYVSRRNGRPGVRAYVNYNHTTFGLKSAAMNGLFLNGPISDNLDVVDELPNFKSMVITDRNAKMLDVDTFVHKDLLRMMSNPNLLVIVAQRNTTYVLDPMGRTSFATEGGHGQAQMSLNDKIGTGWMNVMRTLHWEIWKAFGDPSSPYRSFTMAQDPFHRDFGPIGFTPNAIGISEDYWSVVQQFHNMIGLGMKPELALSIALAHKMRESSDYDEWRSAPPRWSSGLVQTMNSLLMQQANEFGPESIYEKEARQTNGDHYLLGPIVIFDLFMMVISVWADLSPFVGLSLWLWIPGVFLNQVSTLNSLLAYCRHMGFWAGLGRWVSLRIDDSLLFAPRVIRDVLSQIKGYWGVSFEFKMSGGGDPNPWIAIFPFLCRKADPKQKEVFPPRFVLSEKVITVEGDGQWEQTLYIFGPSLWFYFGDVDLNVLRRILRTHAGRTDDETLLKILGKSVDQWGALQEGDVETAFNKILEMPDFYQKIQTDNLTLSEGTRGLLSEARQAHQKKKNLEGKKLLTLNCALLGALYPGAIIENTDRIRKAKRIVDKKHEGGIGGIKQHSRDLTGFFLTFVVGILLLGVNAVVIMTTLNANNAIMMFLSLWFAVGAAFGPMLKAARQGEYVWGGVGDFVAKWGGLLTGLLFLFGASWIAEAVMFGVWPGIPLAIIGMTIWLVIKAGRWQKRFGQKDRLKPRGIRVMSEIRRGFWTAVLLFSFFAFSPLHPGINLDLIPGVPSGLTLVGVGWIAFSIVGFIAFAILFGRFIGRHVGHYSLPRVRARVLDVTAEHQKFRTLDYGLDGAIDGLMTQIEVFIQQEAYRYAALALDRVEDLLQQIKKHPGYRTFLVRKFGALAARHNALLNVMPEVNRNMFEDGKTIRASLQNGHPVASKTVWERFEQTIRQKEFQQKLDALTVRLVNKWPKLPVGQDESTEKIKKEASSLRGEFFDASDDFDLEAAEKAMERLEKLGLPVAQALPGAFGILWAGTKKSLKFIGRVEGLVTGLASWGVLSVLMPQGPPVFSSIFLPLLLTFLLGISVLFILHWALGVYVGKGRSVQFGVKPAWRAMRTAASGLMSLPVLALAYLMPPGWGFMPMFLLGLSIGALLHGKKNEAIEQGKIDDATQLLMDLMGKVQPLGVEDYGRRSGVSRSSFFENESQPWEEFVRHPVAFWDAFYLHWLMATAPEEVTLRTVGEWVRDGHRLGLSASEEKGRETIVVFIQGTHPEPIRKQIREAGAILNNKETGVPRRLVVLLTEAGRDVVRELKGEFGERVDFLLPSQLNTETKMEEELVDGRRGPVRRIKFLLVKGTLIPPSILIALKRMCSQKRYKNLVQIIILKALLEKAPSVSIPLERLDQLLLFRRFMSMQA